VSDTVRLGGMALSNGVLVHGPTAWGCAVRLPSGELRVAAAKKLFATSKLENPLLRGPAKLLESVAVLPQVKRALPEAKLPFERPAVLASLLAATVTVRVLRASQLGAAARELTTGLLSFAPGVLALSGGQLAAYHGAEHISIGSYEHGEPRPREHERCGTHLIGPLLVTQGVANALATAAPRQLRRPVRIVASVGALAAATELFGWMVRNPQKRLSRALAKPGHEFQQRFATAEPTPEQLEVAEAALRACLAAEDGD
jgi:uncharacterized protein YqhQ